ncbi:DNA-binding MarR family transcriptional regulator [Saccharothrix carnea]|uniref:DNA-binding MarR family transcriptional regulator n=1 Tax=Saccharothrix carnea TaxID=1280637 RepID=A0A2P8I1B3_SACCR|nr:DNA-binding MarR family transcriptional regulator [Saccharothrix carnea]
MRTGDDAESRARGWRTLAALHACIVDELERALQRGHNLSVSEYGVLEVLARHDVGAGQRLRMSELSEAVVLSGSATTRLVNRLEQRKLLRRHLSADDRRGIYTAVTEEGRQALERARSTYDESLARALRDAAELPELAPLVDALAALQPDLKPVLEPAAERAAELVEPAGRGVPSPPEAT